MSVFIKILSGVAKGPVRIGVKLHRISLTIEGTATKHVTVQCAFYLVFASIWWDIRVQPLECAESVKLIDWLLPCRILMIISLEPDLIATLLLKHAIVCVWELPDNHKKTWRHVLQMIIKTSRPIMDESQLTVQTTLRHAVANWSVSCTTRIHIWLLWQLCANNLTAKTGNTCMPWIST